MRTTAAQIWFIGILGFFGFLLGGAPVFAVTNNISGYIWGGDNATLSFKNGANFLPMSGWTWGNNAGNTGGIGFVSLGDGATYGLSADDFGAISGITGVPGNEGYAWSSNYGWINFNAGCPANSQGAQLGGNTYAGCNAQFVNPTTTVESGSLTDKTELIGWARACSVFKTDCSGGLKEEIELGGWDGWISLSRYNDQNFTNGTIDIATASNYHVSWNPTTTALSGYAWGGAVTGWVNFAGATMEAPNQPIAVTLTSPNTCSVVDGQISLTWGVTGTGANTYHCTGTSTGVPQKWLGENAVPSQTKTVTVGTVPDTFTISCTSSDPLLPDISESFTTPTSTCTGPVLKIEQNPTWTKMLPDGTQCVDPGDQYPVKVTLDLSAFDDPRIVGARCDTSWGPDIGFKGAYDTGIANGAPCNNASSVYNAFTEYNPPLPSSNPTTKPIPPQVTGVTGQLTMDWNNPFGLYFDKTRCTSYPNTVGNLFNYTTRTNVFGDTFQFSPSGIWSIVQKSDPIPLYKSTPTTPRINSNINTTIAASNIFKLNDDLSSANGLYLNNTYSPIDAHSQCLVYPNGKIPYWNDIYADQNNPIFSIYANGSTEPVYAKPQPPYDEFTLSYCEMSTTLSARPDACQIYGTSVAVDWSVPSTNATTCTASVSCTNANGSSIACAGWSGSKSVTAGMHTESVTITATGGAQELYATLSLTCDNTESGKTSTSTASTVHIQPNAQACVAAAVCGNAVVEVGEQCDAGASNGIACTPGATGCTYCGGGANACKIVTIAPEVCGDGQVDAPEECDDGNIDDTDECYSKGTPNQCTATVCGDGIEQNPNGNTTGGVKFESCDDGNSDDFDGCTTSCSPTVYPTLTADLTIPSCVVSGDGSLPKVSWRSSNALKCVGGGDTDVGFDANGGDLSGTIKIFTGFDNLPLPLLLIPTGSYSISLKCSNSNALPDSILIQKDILVQTSCPTGGGGTSAPIQPVYIDS